MSDAATTPKSRREYHKSGYYKRKRKVNKRGLDGMDARTVEGRDALTFRADAIADLGGQDIATTKKAVLDVAVGERYLWRSGWAFIMEQGGNVVNKRKRSFYPVVKDILAVGESLTKHMKDLGLERVTKTLTLAELLNQDDEPESKPQPDQPEVPQ